MLAVERKRRILEILREYGQIETKALAHQLEVSLATIRRDLAELEYNGLLVRTHGGALARDYAKNQFAGERISNQEDQGIRRVARRASEFVEDGDTIILDSDTAVREMAKMIHGLQDVTVVTHDLKIALELADKPGLHVYHTGGAVYPMLYSTYGMQTIETYKKIKVNKAFLGAEALHSTEGLMSRSMDRAAVRSAIAQSASLVVVLIDSTKVDKMAVFKAVDLDEIHVVITSPDADPAALERFREKGVRVEMV